LILPLKISIAILCGGKSSRFDGDKTQTIFRDKPLYRVIWDRLEPESDEIFLQVRSGKKYDLPTREDLLPEGGPLGGIYSALTHAKHDWLFVSACDLPYLDPRIVDELFLRAEESSEVVIPRWENGYLEPLTAIYNISVLPRLEETLDDGTRKITDFLDRLDNVKEIPVDQFMEEGRISSRCFYNVNTRKDLKKLDFDK